MCKESVDTQPPTDQISPWKDPVKQDQNISNTGKHYLWMQFDRNDRRMSDIETIEI